ncbi:unnamed protein product [Amoebophrya sp. A25]|nr:unnamed protein product [Amoebophrya sp. A25]|eukprot:GSA25T00002699001.1
MSVRAYPPSKAKKTGASAETAAILTKATSFARSLSKVSSSSSSSSSAAVAEGGKKDDVVNGVKSGLGESALASDKGDNDGTTAGKEALPSASPIVEKRPGDAVTSADSSASGLVGETDLKDLAEEKSLKRQTDLKDLAEEKSLKRQTDLKDLSEEKSLKRQREEEDAHNGADGIDETGGKDNTKCAKVEGAEDEAGEEAAAAEASPIKPPCSNTNGGEEVEADQQAASCSSTDPQARQAVAASTKAEASTGGKASSEQMTEEEAERKKNFDELLSQKVWAPSETADAKLLAGEVENAPGIARTTLYKQAKGVQINSLDYRSFKLQIRGLMLERETFAIPASDLRAHIAENSSDGGANLLPKMSACLLEMVTCDLVRFVDKRGNNVNAKAGNKGQTIELVNVNRTATTNGANNEAEGGEKISAASEEKSNVADGAINQDGPAANQDGSLPDQIQSGATFMQSVATSNQSEATSNPSGATSNKDVAPNPGAQ